MSRFFLIVALSAFLGGASPAWAGDWPEFLGPKGTAHSADEVPTRWSETENLKWKVDLPGRGSSSPIVVGDRVIVTCWLGDDAPTSRQVACFNKNTGERLWSVDFPIDYTEDPYRGYIMEHGYASNTPVSDGESVFVFLGKGGVHALGMDGTRKWSVDVGKESSNRQWGSAASLILYQGSVIVNASEESKAIWALDKATGETLWRADAGMLELTYGTPRVVTLADGRSELVVSVPSEMWGLDPANGKLSWYAQTPMTGNVCPSPIVAGDVVYSFGGYRSSGCIAVRAGGKDDVTQSHVLWTNRSSSYVATPLLHEGRFYWINDQGIAYCTSAQDGEVVYRARVGKLEGGRPVYASPIFVGKHIYVVTRYSGTIVYPPGDSFEPIATNVFANDDSIFNATPAVSDGHLYLRSDRALYCIGF
ncbi:MAG: serine/threonine protein kinase [Planctomycetota bacterium]|nr:MAG: serine/threonine protein kinase [Planctomycetota bacterium]